MLSPRHRYYSAVLRLPSLLLLLLLLIAPDAVRADRATPLSLAEGNLPLLIVAGHGGQLPLDQAEVRSPSKVEDPHFVLFGDALTRELATDLAGAVAQEWGDGRRPSLLLNSVHRRFADVNRRPELSSHDPIGRAHHAAYHQAIEHELARLVARHGWALLLDIHGQARYDTTLLLGTAENSVIDDWSKKALWGPGGLIENLHAVGLTAMPQNPEGEQRYGGGYTIRHHGARPEVQAWQMEHSRAVRDTAEARTRYLEAVAQTLVRVIKHHPVTSFKVDSSRQPASGRS